MNINTRYWLKWKKLISSNIGFCGVSTNVILMSALAFAGIALGVYFAHRVHFYIWDILLVGVK